MKFLRSEESHELVIDSFFIYEGILSYDPNFFNEIMKKFNENFLVLNFTVGVKIQNWIEITFHSEEYELIQFSILNLNSNRGNFQSRIKCKNYTEKDFKFLLEFHDKARKIISNL